MNFMRGVTRGVEIVGSKTAMHFVKSGGLGANVVHAADAAVHTWQEVPHPSFKSAHPTHEMFDSSLEFSTEEEFGDLSDHDVEPEELPEDPKSLLNRTHVKSQKILSGIPSEAEAKEMIETLLREAGGELLESSDHAPDSLKLAKKKTEERTPGPMAKAVMRGHEKSKDTESHPSKSTASTGQPSGVKRDRSMADSVIRGSSLVVKRGYHTAARPPLGPTKIDRFLESQSKTEPKAKIVKMLIDNMDPVLVDFINGFIEDTKDMTIDDLMDVIIYAKEAGEVFGNTEHKDELPTYPLEEKKVKESLQNLQKQISDPSKHEEIRKEVKEYLKKTEPPSDLSPEELAEWKDKHEALLKIINDPDYLQKTVGSILNTISEEVVSVTKYKFNENKKKFVEHLRRYKPVHGDEKSKVADVICDKLADAIDKMESPAQIKKIYNKIYTFVKFCEANPEVLEKGKKIQKGDGGLGDEAIRLIEDMTKSIEEAPGVFSVPKDAGPEVWLVATKHFSEGTAATEFFETFQAREANPLGKQRWKVFAAIAMAVSAYSLWNKKSWIEQRDALVESRAASDKICTKIDTNSRLAGFVIEEVRENAEKSTEAVETQKKIQDMEKNQEVRDFVSLMGDQTVLEYLNDPSISLMDFIELNRDKINARKKQGYGLFSGNTAKALEQKLKEDTEVIGEYFELKKKGKELNPEKLTLKELLKVNKQHRQNMEKMMPLEASHEELNTNAQELKSTIENLRNADKQRPKIESSPCAFILDNIMNKTDKKLKEAIDGKIDNHGKYVKLPLNTQLENCQKSEQQLLEKTLKQAEKATDALDSNQKLEFKNNILAKLLAQIPEMIKAAPSSVEKEELRVLESNIKREIKQNHSRSLKEYVQKERFFNVNV